MCRWRWEQGDESHRDTLSQVSGFPDPGAPLGFTPGRRACAVLGTETKSWARVPIAGQFRTAFHRDRRAQPQRNAGTGQSAWSTAQP